MMGKKNKEQFPMNTAFARSSLEGPSLWLLLFPLGTCLCLHCLLLVSDFLKVGTSLIHIHAASQQLTPWDITDATGTQRVGMGGSTDVKGSN